MPLSILLKKASSYILGDSSSNSQNVIYQDGEALFCKNNVCVHPPSLFRQNCEIIHHPGYMTVICRLDKNTNVPSLHLSWIPNSTLCKHPTALENIILRKDVPVSEGTSLNKINDDESSINSEKIDVCLEVKEPLDCKDCERICSGGLFNEESLSDTEQSCKKNFNNQELNKVQNNEEPSESTMGKRVFSTIIKEKIASSNDELRGINLNNLKSRSHDQGSMESLNYGIEPKSISTISLNSCCSLSTSFDHELPNWMRSPELLAHQHNLTFPESTTASPLAVRRAHQCRKFCVDLGQMRSLRLFFADPACTSGQLVVASRESQYKILHFHHGGLDRLATILHQWHHLVYSKPDQTADCEGSLPYRHFMVCRPEIARDELHPEEGKVPMITSLAWKDLLNERGQVEDDLTLRKGIFFGGLEPALRKIVWPFLLHCYSYQTTYEDREQIDAIRRREYQEIENLRSNMSPEQAEKFWRNVVCIVEKDVVRTDRANPYYAGENNPNIQVMKNILLNYAVYNAQLGYTQGMSDLLAPLLVELNSEIDAFWCFAGLMQRSVAVCTPTDMDMDKNLCYLRELIRIMVPDFYAHLEKYTDALELLFCHRWILLCLKREFPTEMALVMWEACWVNYLTDYFHLFLCLAIICIYADDVIAQDLRTDEMLLHFSSLAMYMDGNVILRKARGLLHQFRQLDRLPCTLAGLCRQCGPGMWDSSHDPVIECVEHEDSVCPYIENYQNVKY
ncbi:TBC1 domain family member 16 [Chelonus insularis]|uniref:TBC1 domain family member 16 n=1 Tax=Chelonus insularis TaxID=460826 RepID=UPI00158843EA|nr:TBC1 domain family member 16 [Chelonus insularis]